MKGSSFDTPGFRRHLEGALTEAVGSYFEKETKEAAKRKVDIQKQRGSYWSGMEHTGWVEEYTLVVDHFRAYGGGHGVRISVRDSDRLFTITPHYNVKGNWTVTLSHGRDEHQLNMERSDNLDSLIQQCVVMAIGEAYLEPELLPEPKPAKVNAKTTKRKG